MARSWNVREEGVENGTPKRQGRPEGGPSFRTVFDVTYLKSVPAVLVIIQIICSFLGFVISVAWKGKHSVGHTVFILTTFSVFIGSLALLIIRAIKLDDLLNRNINWILIWTCYSGAAAVFTLIMSCIMMEAAKAESALKAASVFGLFAWTALLATFLINGQILLQQNKGWLPEVTATVTSVERTSQPRSRSSGEEQSDDFSEDDDDGVPGNVTLTGSSQYRDLVRSTPTHT